MWVELCLNIFLARYLKTQENQIRALQTYQLQKFLLKAISAVSQKFVPHSNYPLYGNMDMNYKWCNKMVFCWLFD